MKQRNVILVSLFKIITCFFIKTPPKRVVMEDFDFGTSRSSRELEHVSTTIELSNFISYTIIQKEGKCNCTTLESQQFDFVHSPYHECQILSCHNHSQKCWGSILESSLTDENGTEHDSKCEYSAQSSGNFTVFCHCAQIGSNSPTDKVIRSFSLREQESDIDKNMIVTGVKFSLKNTMIHLKIKQAKLLLDGSVSEVSSWKELGDIVQKSESSDSADWNDLIPGVDYISLTYNLRAMFLDEIYVPNGYVVTGVRLSEIRSSDSKPGIKLEVKGTQYKFLSHKLIPGTDKWFDYESSPRSGDTYERPREETPLDNCDDPLLATNNVKKGTNKLVVFRATDLKKDSGDHVIPFLSSEPAEVENLPMHGVGLFYTGEDGFGGLVHFEAFHREDSNCIEP